jgi:hypothetical protein
MRLANGMAVELLAPSDNRFPFDPGPPGSHWPSGADAGCRSRSPAPAGTATRSSHSHQVLAPQDDLLRQLQHGIQSDRWELSAAKFDRHLATTAWEASGAADLGPGGAAASW